MGSRPAARGCVTLPSPSNDERADAMASILGFTGLGLCVLACIVLCRLQPTLRLALWTALAVRVAAALFQYFIAPLPDSQLDAAGFERLAWAVSQSGIEGVVAGFKIDAFLYARLLGLIYAISDRSPLLLQSVNVLIGLVNVLLGWRLARKLWDERSALRAAWVLALFPTLILYSAITMREAPIVLCLLAGTLAAINWYRHRRIRHLTIAILWFAFGTCLHGAFIVVVTSLLVIALYYESKRCFRRMLAGWLQPSSLAVTFAGLATIAVVTSFASIIIVPKVGRLDQAFDTLRLIQQMTVVNFADAAYPSWLVPDNGAEILPLLLPRIVYFLASPFPWDIGKPQHLIGLVDGQMYVLLVFLLWRARREIAANAEARFVLLLFLPLLIAFSIGVGNFGTALRHRSKFVILLVALVATRLPRLTWKRVQRVRGAQPSSAPAAE